MAHEYFAPAFLARHPFRTDRVLAELDLPLLLFHGRRDDIIPVSHGRALRDVAPDARYVEYDCRHNDFPGGTNLREYWREIGTFLRDHGIIDSMD